MTLHNDNRLVYFVIGVGLGLLGGLLLAPRSGEEIREEVRKRTNEGLDYFNQQADRLRERTERAVNKTKDWIGRHRGGGQSTSAESASPFGEEKPMT